MAYKNSSLWQQAFRDEDDQLADPRKLLVVAFNEFRSRVSLLVSSIHKDMPSLTVHDITHIDALWQTASEIAGPEYPLNPAEAFVLGGAFLLHDAAHCLAAYPGGITELQQTQDWQDRAAASSVQPLVPGSEAFQCVLFDVLRTLHPKQAKRLASISWQAPGESAPMYLLAHDELRLAYGDVIGLLAESHWWSPHELETLAQRRINPPTCLPHAPWEVDVLKLAVLLRTADAAHIDAQRAPRFLMALTQPTGSSLPHWQFQSRLQQVKRDADAERHELRITGTPFPATEQNAWWLAYDAARMIDGELRAVDRLLLEHNRPRLAARSVAFAYGPEAFARNVPTDGWQPVDTAVKITDIKSLVEQFGGKKLYGDDPAMALRELLQNAVDAIHAARKLGYLSENEGEIEVAIEDVPEGHWLHVTDTGIGMSRYVLTDVLLDFGRSLWRSADVRGEWSGLQASGFEAIGQFGIGFFAVFMLGERVRVLTRRCEPKTGEDNQWLLEFSEGTRQRPILCVPDSGERLKKHGTKVSVLVSKDTLQALRKNTNASHLTLAQVCARLAPALDIDLYIRLTNAERTRIVEANDWLSLPSIDLLRRIAPTQFDDVNPEKFGLWTHLDELRSPDGNVIGRCAVRPPHYYFPKANPGTGVVRGLFAGTVPCIAGVIFAKSQTDLARKDAIPDIAVGELRAWAQRQKKLLIDHQAIDEKDSAQLAGFGVTHSGLVLGKLGGQLVTYEEFVNGISRLSEILIHDDGRVSHDDDDDVLRRDFDSHFEPNESLLEISLTQIPDWLNKIADEAMDRSAWSLKHVMHRALAEAWGGYEEDTKTVVVGDVLGSEITRYCTVVSPVEQVHPDTTEPDTP